MASTLHNPVGRSAVDAAQSRAERSQPYRDARAEYERIRALKEISPIAAHLRERRFELGLTQEEVAQAASTSHSAISRLEKGTHIPQLPTLQRIAAVLDEELLVCFQRTVDGEVEREFEPWHNYLADNSAIEWTEATWNPVTGCDDTRLVCSSCDELVQGGARTPYRQPPARARGSRDHQL